MPFFIFIVIILGLITFILLKNNDDKVKAARKEATKDIIKLLKNVEKEKWDDAVHCTCLGYAINLLTSVDPDDQIEYKRIMNLK